MKNIRVYVGCALTHAPLEYRQMIESFKNKLRLVTWITVLDFVTPESVLPSPDSIGIYQNDIHECIGTADVFIADVTYPSLGLGWELGTAIEKHKILTIMCHQKDARISNLVLGAPGKNSYTSIHKYEQFLHELLPFFLKEIKSLNTSI